MAERLTVTLHELVAGMDAYADAYLRTAHGVSYNLFELLNVLIEKAPIDISGLASALGVSKAAVSKRVPALVADGWVATAPGGGRRVELTPTAAAAELVREAGGWLEHEFAEVISSSRSGPVSPQQLNESLTSLLVILRSKGTP